MTSTDFSTYNIIASFYLRFLKFEKLKTFKKIKLFDDSE